MYRVYHNQTVAGAILIDDIDDGLPNKVVHRLGSTGDPHAYIRDGYANKPKQPCYVPLTQASTGFPLVQGYINLKQTPRVVLSAGKGKLSKLQAAGLITVVSMAAADVAAPALTTAVLNAGVLTLTGTTFLSVAPDSTTVVITGTAAVTLTAAAITTGGGTVGATSIVIPAALVPGISATTSSAKVVANGQSTSVVVLTASVPATPVLTSAVLAGGHLTLTGTSFVSTLPLLTSVAITGTGAVSLTAAQITGGAGTISATSIVIPTALIPGVVVTASSARVTANALNSSVVALT